MSRLEWLSVATAGDGYGYHQYKDGTNWCCVVDEDTGIAYSVYLDERELAAGPWLVVEHLVEP